MMHNAGILLAAFILDLVLGDPVYPLHPVRLIGRVISGIEKILQMLKLGGIGGGIMLTVTVLAITLGCYWSLNFLLASLHHGAAVVFDLFIVYSCIACGDLLKHCRPVAETLDRNDLAAARNAVQKIVGRKTDVLDAHGVARAAIESASESFLDGFFAPVFWYVIGALGASFFNLAPTPWAVTAMLAYKTTNTLDSMIGYRNERYLYFGRAGARLDDALNFLPARLSITALIPAAVLCRLNAGAGLQIFRRDRFKHESPNSAHTESFTAGALGLRLGGPLEYPDGMVVKPWLGDGSPDAAGKDIRSACRLILYASWFSIFLFAAILLAARVV